MPEQKISLADQIRDKLDAGVLPRVLPEKMWTVSRSQTSFAGVPDPS